MSTIVVFSVQLADSPQRVLERLEHLRRKMAEHLGEPVVALTVDEVETVDDGALEPDPEDPVA